MWSTARLSLRISARSVPHWVRLGKLEARPQVVDLQTSFVSSQSPFLWRHGKVNVRRSLTVVVLRELPYPGFTSRGSALPHHAGCFISFPSPTSLTQPWPTDLLRNSTVKDTSCKMSLGGYVPIQLMPTPTNCATEYKSLRSFLLIMRHLPFHLSTGQYTKRKLVSQIIFITHTMSGDLHCFGLSSSMRSYI